MTSSKVFSWEVCLPLSRIAPYYPHTALLSKMFRSCSVLLALVRSCNFLRKCYEFSCFWYIFLVIWCREFIGISLFMWNCGGNCDEHFLTSSTVRVGSMIRTDPGSRSLGSDPGIRFRDPRTCLIAGRGAPGNTRWEVMTAGPDPFRGAIWFVLGALSPALENWPFSGPVLPRRSILSWILNPREFLPNWSYFSSCIFFFVWEAGSIKESRVPSLFSFLSQTICLVSPTPIRYVSLPVWSWREQSFNQILAFHWRGKRRSLEGQSAPVEGKLPLQLTCYPRSCRVVVWTQWTGMRQCPMIWESSVIAADNRWWLISGRSESDRGRWSDGQITVRVQCGTNTPAQTASWRWPGESYAHDSWPRCFCWQVRWRQAAWPSSVLCWQYLLQCLTLTSPTVLSHPALSSQVLCSRTLGSSHTFLDLSMKHKTI